MYYINIQIVVHRCLSTAVPITSSEEVGEEESMEYKHGGMKLTENFLPKEKKEHKKQGAVRENDRYKGGKLIVRLGKTVVGLSCFVAYIYI